MLMLQRNFWGTGFVCYSLIASLLTWHRSLRRMSSQEPRSVSPIVLKVQTPGLEESAVHAVAAADLL